MRAAFALIAGLLAASMADAAECFARSGAGTAVLVELYTAEGCSGCALAERWLRNLPASGYPPDRVVAVALHVNARDYLNRGDSSMRGAHTSRQRKLTAAQRLALVYTPQVMLQGRPFPAWDTPQFAEVVTRLNARPAGAQIELRSRWVAHAASILRVEAAAEVHESQQANGAALYLAAYEGTQAHPHLLLEWQGPIPLVAGRVLERRDLPLPPGALGERSGVAAFVQNRRGGEVLQALILPACRG